MKRNSILPYAGISALFIALAAFSLGAWRIAWAETPDPSTKLTSGLAAETVLATTDNSEKSTADNVKPSVMYRVKPVGGQWKSWSGNGAQAGLAGRKGKLETLAIKLADGKKSAIQYQVHVSGYGWMFARQNGAAAGFPGKSKAIDAVRVALVGELSKTYSVKYRVNSAASGWQSWKSNGSVAGSKAAKDPISAIQVKLVKHKAATSAKGNGIVSVRYRAMTKPGGWSTYQANYEKAPSATKTGRIRGLRIALDNGTYSGAIKYTVRTVGGKWTSWKQNGQTLTAQNDIEAVRIRVSGKLSKAYDVVYSVRVHRIGWQRRMRNGEAAGTKGLELPLESIRVNLIPKSKVSGWVNDGGNWSYYESGVKQKNRWIDTNEHPIDLSIGSSQRYWLDSNGNLAINRYVNPKDARDKKAKMLAFATPSGYVARGKYTNEDGIVFARDTGRLYTKARWLTFGESDGSRHCYRLVRKGVCAVAQTGLFKVDGKKYYGWEDGRGYVMCSESKWIDKKWYVANKNGVLTENNSDLIERYVSWAIQTANDNSHGYSQANRWGPDYDCSSFVCAAIMAAGVPDSGASWTGNMKANLRRVGFVWHKGTHGIRWGDIMLVHNDNRKHTEIYLGDGYLVGAHISETGGIYGEAGDQTGREISLTSYYNAPWQGYLRFNG